MLNESLPWSCLRGLSLRPPLNTQPRISNDLKWSQMISNDLKWSQMISNTQSRMFSDDRWGRVCSPAALPYEVHIRTRWAWRRLWQHQCSPSSSATKRCATRTILQRMQVGLRTFEIFWDCLASSSFLEWNPLAATTSLESCIFLYAKPSCCVTLYQSQTISTITYIKTKQILKGDDFFYDFLKGFFCFSVWGSFPCYLLHFGTTISDLRAICCVLEPKSLICMLFVAFWS